MQSYARGHDSPDQRAPVPEQIQFPVVHSTGAVCLGLASRQSRFEIRDRLWSLESVSKVPKRFRSPHNLWRHSGRRERSRSHASNHRALPNHTQWGAMTSPASVDAVFRLREATLVGWPDLDGHSAGLGDSLGADGNGGGMGSGCCWIIAPLIATRLVCYDPPTWRLFTRPRGVDGQSYYEIVGSERWERSPLL